MYKAGDRVKHSFFNYSGTITIVHNWPAGIHFRVIWDNGLPCIYREADRILMKSKISSVWIRLKRFIMSLVESGKVILIKPKRCGNAYFCDSEGIPFKLEGNFYVECEPMNYSGNFKPRIFHKNEAKIKE